ncbi:polysaccharide deacetylase family protein [Leptobacterium flavescens]|nr:polysaccharide deacetylase family protein [Leptobacterium flavescens]
MKHVFTKMLQIEVAFTTKVEDFIGHTGAKITYTRQPLQNEFFIKSHELLFEQGVRDVEIHIQQWDDIPCFFPTSEKSAVPFDVFAASFYMISRYEEYLPYVKDVHGRFPATESLAYQNDFLEIPVVDIWVNKLKLALLKRFPDLQIVKREYEHLSIIDVSVSHCFRERGIIRSLGGMLIDFFSLKIGRMITRLAVLLRIKKDPYNNFQELIEMHKEYGTRAIFFFLLADYSNYDKNISINNPRFRSLVKSVADYSIVSLMASYNSYNNPKILKKDRARLIELIRRPVKRVRLRFNRVNIPESYKTVVEAEFNEDYSMGYTLFPGFRAGTCTPFFFYDISFEVQLPLKVTPFCVEDYGLTRYKNTKEAVQVYRRIREQVRKVNGTFVTVFSNEILGGAMKQPWKDIYYELLKDKH